jgi:hypothetical protein
MRLRFVSLALGIGLYGGLAFGQQIGQAALNGKVTDQSGAVVANAKVSAVQPATGLTRTTETTGSGLYTFTSLPAGLFTVSIEKTGFGSVKAENVELSVGANATLDFKLQVGATAESVTVTSDAPVVETTRSQTSTIISSQAVEQLPVNGRNILDIALTTPGVVRDPTRTGDFSFGGQRGTANSLQV